MTVNPFLLDIVRLLFSHLTTDTMKDIVGIDILHGNVINHQIRTMEDNLYFSFISEIIMFVFMAKGIFERWVKTKGEIPLSFI